MSRMYSKWDMRFIESIGSQLIKSIDKGYISVMAMRLCLVSDFANVKNKKDKMNGVNNSGKSLIKSR